MRNKKKIEENGSFFLCIYIVNNVSALDADDGNVRDRIGVTNWLEMGAIARKISSSEIAAVA